MRNYSLIINNFGNWFYFSGNADGNMLQKSITNKFMDALLDVEQVQTDASVALASVMAMVDGWVDQEYDQGAAAIPAPVALYTAKIKTTNMNTMNIATKPKNMIQKKREVCQEQEIVKGGSKKKRKTGSFLDKYIK